MLSIILAIILLPIALVSLSILGLGAMLVWRYIVAIFFWIAALFVYVFFKGTDNTALWVAIGLAVTGIFIWVNDDSSNPTKKPTDE